MKDKEHKSRPDRSGRLSSYHLKFRLLRSIHLRHVRDEVDDLAGITPLVAVSSRELDEPGVQHDARLGVEDAGAGVATPPYASGKKARIKGPARPERSLRYSGSCLLRL
jgi:hypothetical protein